MINRIDRYIGFSVFKGALAALAALAALTMLFSYVEEMNQTTQNYGAFDAVLFVLMKLPTALFGFLPMAMLIGGLMVLGNMASHTELTVLRASGVSLFRLGRSVLFGGLLFVGFSLVLSEVIAPVMLEKANQLKASKKGGHVALKAGGVWFKNGNQSVNIKRVKSQTELSGVAIYVIEKNEVIREIHAKSALVQPDRWKLNQVKDYLFGESPQVKTYKMLLIDSPVESHVIEVLTQTPEEMSLSSLSVFIKHLQANKLNSLRYEAAWWVKVFMPLSILVMLLIVLPFVFGSQRTGNAGQYLFVGVVIGLIYVLLSRMINQFSPVYGLSAFASAAMPVGLFLLISIVRLRRLS